MPRRVMEAGTSKVRLGGYTAHPTAGWLTQYARRFSRQIRDGTVPCRFLIHDRDAKFLTSFDAVFRSEGAGTVRTPYHAPRANAVAERWVCSVRREWLDHLLIHPPDRKFVAYYAVCAHNGCTVKYDPTWHQLDRPCHGAIFDPLHAGSDVDGPAQLPSPTLQVTIASYGIAYAMTAG